MKLLIFCCPLLLILIACGETADDAPRELTKVEGYMGDPAAVARGEAIFAGSCSAYCHTIEQEETDALYLFDCEWKHGNSDQEIFATVTTGVPATRMVGFGSNFPEGEEDLWKLIAYLRINQRACG